MSRQLHLDSPRYPQPCGDRECRRCYPPTPAEARAAYVAAWDELQRSDLDRFREAVEQFHAALVELLLPACEAIVAAIERLADAWHDSRPVRWLNRRARRAAMRRHPAGSQPGVVTVDVSLDMSGFLAALDALPSAEDLARRAGIRLPELPASRIYTPPAALSWVDVDRLAERAGRDLGTFDAIVAGPTPAEIPPAPLCQPVNAGQHVGRMRRHTWRELLQLPGGDMA
ncbi:hypothetical protein SEA_EKKO14_2 [Microbacterium phage Ekko14]|uniref:Uncharacterized protein n=1 Tax=Microbacterium phage Noelani TaxID=2250371 RepID=A0A2Z5HE77_9CAUD|nr:hypothetical protein JTF56_gp02 [Microbacterium phage Noelani]AXC38243.1 hypothetical protein SEA_NOELANI_2 [Microbacterium phage Noelani]QGJ91592.1 hypothetical protein SEA_HARPERANNE_2 [Microbacterium phage HarperAnne]QPN96344.1 hypothetical protein SEA_LUNATIC_2 [Microbacterium phage Lunatic]